MAKPNRAQEPASNTDAGTSVIPAGAAAVASLSKFKVAKRVTMPTINPATNVPYIFKIMDAFRKSTYVKPVVAGEEEKKEKPATICTVTDMETGQIALWLVPEVAYKNITEQYPDDSYVGKIFGCQKLPKRPGKRYFDFEIAELELDEA